MVATAAALTAFATDIEASARALGAALSAVKVHHAPPQVARAVQAAENVYAGIEEEFGLLSATEAGRLMGSRSSAPRNMAADARRSGRLLGLQRGGAVTYPGFQFDSDGQPLPVIADLCALAGRMGRSETGAIQWLCAPTTYLDGQRPVDLLRTDSTKVLDVAGSAWTVEW